MGSSFAVAAALVLWAAAPASAVPVRGVVSGPVYEASRGTIAVPTLYSRQTARRLRLRSSVGISIVPALASVPLPGGGSTPPVGLRVGDRFEGSARVSRRVRRTSQPRIAFRWLAVYQRGPAPAADALLVQLAQLAQKTDSNALILSPLTTTVENLLGTATSTTVLLDATVNRVLVLETVLSGITNSTLTQTIANANKLTSITQMQLNDTVANATKLAGHTQAAVDDTVANAAKLAAHSQAVIDSTVADAAKLAAHSQATLDATIANAAKLASYPQATVDDTVTNAAKLAGHSQTAIDNTVTNAAKLAGHSQTAIDDTVTNAAKLVNLSQATLEATVAKVDNLCTQVAALSQEFNDLRAALAAAGLLGLDLSGVSAVPAFSGVTCAP